MPRLDLLSSDARRLVLGESDVEYVLQRRPRRRGVSLRVDGHGLTVSAAPSIPVSRVEAFLRENERWVLRKIAEWGERRVPEAVWKDGAVLPYLGGTVVLRVSCGSRASAQLMDGELHVTVREVLDAAVQRAVVAWYKRAALSHLAERAFTIARLGALPMPRVFLSSARTRWGSCNAKREVRLAWRLVKAPPAIIDYVVCHELAHLRHMDHSPRFWAEVERLCPGYKPLRRELMATDHLYRAF